ncbi:mitogen-activated protein kinase kinase kinase 4-like [Lingula anatina]|uniref:Mitogen-activated protein kinase kinase kinase 4 n=1 Tax=Lingula anatina TaxID=7574 RepID=A0A1S3HN56_LINAN|nr:mitogen-activated protein kinase kinase kinase 4-like [Lingula anatina]|eukprot:XP_013387498.1 mitogen-activated protein kinase kinase kinase 4-like [Lingula anatina]
MLRKDLEIAADFNILVEPAQLLEKLKETDHIKVNAPANAGYLMFIPHHISEDKEQILQLLNVTCGREDIHHSFPVGKESHEGYLLLVRWETGTCGWEGTSVRVEPTAETTIALSHIEVEGLLLVVINSSQLPAQRKSFKRSMGSAVELVNEQTSCHQAIAESLIDLKTTAMYLREKVAKAIIQVDEKLNLDDISEREEMEKYNILKLYRETMHQCYNFGFEYHKEVTRLVTGDARQKLAHGLISFAKEWTKFVTQKCERGRGVKPRWAMQGLEFLTVACEARVLALLTEGEFLDLKHSINNCISHVIGSSSDKTGSPNFRTSSPDPVNAQRNAMIYRNLSCPEPAPSPKPIRTRSVLSDPATSPHPSQSDPWLGGNPAASPSRAVEIHDGENGGIVMDVHVRPKEKQVVPRVPLKPMERVHQAVARLEQDQNERLLAKRRIGRITTQRSDNNCHLHMRRVHFKWQRGNKIGEGQFGKVYCAVNMDNGELMAMKEIRFQPNDHQTIKDIADEISLFESIQHQSLVRYFGVEVHRDEMVIFMEYCDEGTIEEAAKMGLTEPLIRKYTKEILVAISLLHDNKIVHRDIKGANIFLQSKGPLKLGDFGCSVKLKNHTTMPGEINTLVGTTAYMAPEVITHNDREGHGRAADIWSLGCVVIEMATGKRPWHELENNYQIMFKVGMGCKPAIPDTLSEEGKDFLSHCLEIDPRERWTASQLLGHSFTKFALDDEVEEQESHQPRVLAMPHAISESEEA